MNRTANLILGFVITASCLMGTSVPPNSAQFAVLDHVFALTGTHSPTGVTALELLQLVALGRTSSIKAGAETQVGLSPGMLGHPLFAVGAVREYAFEKIGACDWPEALDFLQHLKREDLGEDTTQMVWHGSRIALKAALLLRIKDPQSRTNFLLDTLKEGEVFGMIAYWAGNQLCDQGVSTALPLIRRSISKNWSGTYAEETTTFCERRMEVVARDPDRAKALGSILTVDNGDASERLMYWAVGQLESMHSQGADAELDRFAKELDRLREGMPQYTRFWGIREEVRKVRLKRAKQQSGER